jgi:hypothetical protein
MTRRALLALGVIVIAASCDRRPRNDASGVVTRLYETLDRLGVDGAPTAQQLDAITPFVSKELHDLLHDADALREAEQKRAPDEKPAFAEGDLFTSLFEGPSSFEVASDTAGPNGIHVVRMNFTLSGAPTPLQWSDRVVVNSEGGRLVVTDVLYDGDWPFANKGSLLGSLRAALRGAKSDSTSAPTT